MREPNGGGQLDFALEPDDDPPGFAFEPDGDPLDLAPEPASVEGRAEGDSVRGPKPEGPPLEPGGGQPEDMREPNGGGQLDFALERDDDALGSAFEPDGDPLGLAPEPGSVEGWREVRDRSLAAL